MYAIEFEEDVQNGIIKTPDTYKELNSQHSKVIILFDDSDMLCQPEKNQNAKTRLFSDEYINAYWHDLIMTTSTDPQ